MQYLFDIIYVCNMVNLIRICYLQNKTNKKWLFIKIDHNNVIVYIEYYK